MERIPGNPDSRGELRNRLNNNQRSESVFRRLIPIPILIPTAGPGEGGVASSHGETATLGDGVRGKDFLHAFDHGGRGEPVLRAQMLHRTGMFEMRMTGVVTPCSLNNSSTAAP